ncbi:MAG TPA: hypothetical protein VEZ42_17750 [Pseudonocardia sp.]|nr:hypothetical protein [Pseudonocardia sp.]
MIVDFALGVSAIPGPIRFSTSEPDAVAWLRHESAHVDPGT